MPQHAFWCIVLFRQILHCDGSSNLLISSFGKGQQYLHLLTHCVLFQLHPDRGAEPFLRLLHLGVAPGVISYHGTCPTSPCWCTAVICLVGTSCVCFPADQPALHPFGQVVEQKAARTPGKKSLAIEAYARALRAIPGTICDNAGTPNWLSCHNILASALL